MTENEQDRLSYLAVVMARSRWKLRRAIAVMNQCLEQLRLEKHPGKTSMGRTRRGFDFLGYHFRPAGDDQVTAGKPPVPAQAKEGSCPAAGTEPDRKALEGDTAHKALQVRLAPAQKTLRNYLENYARLYEQGADKDRAGQYSKRWHQWCRAGLEGYVEPYSVSIAVELSCAPFCILMPFISALR